MRSQEARARRLAARQGLRLVRARSRTPQDYLYGTYGLIDDETNAWVAHDACQRGYGLTLAEVEAWLAEPAPA
jgi:hypothetical protein